ncbi:calcium/sodium antiporter [Yeosuana sp.]|uniref:calcium/sodium antiporter n=1 Tax=Yeosuana sp. TaxID=2529388 RepID=UPI004054C4EE|tara:strand:+ start:4120 stop:5064 length:945 start_codon:yes stop_codon:yes gene_type:complete
MSVVWVILGFVLLVVGGEFLVRSSVALSFKFNISKMVIGMTVVSFATSVPELLVSLQAALTGSPAIAINNVIGSNIANIGLILGLTAMVGTIVVDKAFYKINWPVLMLFSMTLYYFLYNDNMLSFIEGFILFTGIVLFLIILIRNSKEASVSDGVDDSLSTISNFKISIWLLIGAASLYFGSEWLVDGAKGIAISLGVSEAVIGVSLIAIGTSVPELAASIIAALKQEKAISLGNLIGSNIFNIGSVLGLTAMVKPIPVTESQILSNDIFWMLGFTFILLPMVFIPKKFEITRAKGFFLVFAYSIFIVLIFTAK